MDSLRLRKSIVRIRAISGQLFEFGQRYKWPTWLGMFARNDRFGSKADLPKTHDTDVSYLGRKTAL